eukprot:700541-Pelagomonas_calceolata.AAC.4
MVQGNGDQRRSSDAGAILQTKHLGPRSMHQQEQTMCMYLAQTIGARASGGHSGQKCVQNMLRSQHESTPLQISCGLHTGKTSKPEDAKDCRTWTRREQEMKRCFFPKSRPHIKSSIEDSPGQRWPHQAAGSWGSSRQPWQWPRMLLTHDPTTGNGQARRCMPTPQLQLHNGLGLFSESLNRAVFAGVQAQ